MKGIILIVVISIMLIGCTTKPDVIIIDGNTYYFKEGVENFYIVDAQGNKREVTK